MTIIAKKEKKMKKSCFIITPVGEEGSEIRIEANGIIEAVIKPVLEDDYNVDAAHLSISSVVITKEIVNSIFNADLIIANLTNSNPNVMYELSFAHALRKPVVHLIRDGQRPPFDISNQRYITYTNNLFGVVKLKEQLKIFVEEVTKSDATISNPITDSIDVISIKSVERDASVSKILESIVYRISNIEKAINKNEFKYFENIRHIPSINTQKEIMALVEFLGVNDVTLDELMRDDNLIREASNHMRVSSSYLRKILNDNHNLITGSPI